MHGISFDSSEGVDTSCSELGDESNVGIYAAETLIAGTVTIRVPAELLITPLHGVTTHVVLV